MKSVLVNIVMFILTYKDVILISLAVFSALCLSFFIYVLYSEHVKSKHTELSIKVWCGVCMALSVLCCAQCSWLYYI